MADAVGAMVFALRREHPLSGERRARQALEAVLGGALCNAEAFLAPPGSKFLDWLVRPFRLHRLLRAQTGTVVLKIPTLGQTWMARVLLLGCRARVLLWVEGLCWARPSRILWLRMLRHEPLLALARCLMNGRAVARPFLDFPWEGVVSSEVQRREILALDPRRTVHVVPNFLDPTLLGPVRPKPPSSVLCIGFLGHAYWTKGLSDLLGALARLRAEGLPFEARFAFSDLGSARLRAETSAAGYRVEGEVDLSAFFAGINLLACPFWVDWGTNAFPNVLLEALHTGTPVLSTDLPLVLEAFGGRRDLLLTVPPGDAEALASVLRDVILGQNLLPGQNELAGHAARAFDSMRTASQWSALLRKTPA